ncbi:MAG: DEAD/DEAH box helicase [Oscillospiraceae bacterium]|nr:DEAD/DEAH box helicase [Oscillospiraceae bacterium]
MAIKRDKKQIQDILTLIEQFDEALAEIASQPMKIQEAAADAFKNLTETELSHVLRGMDVENVNRDKLGIRVASLRSAGIENMEQLCALTLDQINAVKGIGDEAACLIYTLAGRIRQEAAAGLKVRVNLDERSGAASALLLTARAAMQTAKASGDAQAIWDEYHEGITAACLDAKPAGSTLRWLILPGEKKQRAVDAALYLYDLLTGDYGERVRAVMDAYDARELLDADTVWEDFKKHSAAYYAEFDRLDRMVGTLVDNSYSGLPEELVRQVEMQPLYTDCLHATLRSYQEFGTRYILRQGNVLLGDEMGLGKTVQAIAAMVSLKAMGGTHFMVVCPASVLVNWCREIKQFSDLTVTLIRGGDQGAVRKWTEQGGVAVTTYESISRFYLPESFRFSMLVADEAHYAKNPAARRTQALLILRRRAERVLFMTGTPLENKVDEMCFLVSCLRSDIAGQIREMKYISSAPQFREKLSPVYLRRTRNDVLSELPELIEKEEWCEMGLAEWKAYTLSVASENFMAMRQVSWDVDLKHSSKAKRLLELCDEAKEDGRKIIVFTYFRETIRAVQKLLGTRALDPITGSVSPARRQEIVDAFTQAEDGKVLICQVQAGGTGLNIQAASVIIFCEPQIKPSIENQAVSRAYRMGQLRSVMVHRLLCDNTVDERILELLREKQDVFDFFAEESTVGSEYLRAEKSITAAIIEMEKERLASEEPPEEA